MHLKSILMIIGFNILRQAMRQMDIKDSIKSNFQNYTVRILQLVFNHY